MWADPVLVFGKEGAEGLQFQQWAAGRGSVEPRDTPGLGIFLFICFEFLFLVFFFLHLFLCFSFSFLCMYLCFKVYS